jgi:hypothetical protein
MREAPAATPTLSGSGAPRSIAGDARGLLVKEDAGGRSTSYRLAD